MAPFQLMAPLMHSIPQVPRPLRRPEADKSKRYLELADIIMKRFATDTTAKSVAFLLDLVKNVNPGAAPPLPWYSRVDQLDPVRVGLPSVVSRVAPRPMRFEARFL